MSLKNLIALQKQKQAAEPAKPAESVEPAKPKGLGLNTAGKPKPKVEHTVADPAKPAPVIDSDNFSLDDLAALEASTVDTVEESARYTSEFEDEIEATAPDRDLPADLTPEMLSFVESLDGVYQVLHDPEMFGQAVRVIMIELQENQEYERLLADPDIHVMIRGMRRTMGLARVRKQEKSRKGKTQTNARKKAGVSDDAMALLNSLMGGDDD